MSPVLRTAATVRWITAVSYTHLIGLILAGAYMYRSQYTRSFVAALAILPAVVCVVIMMVNGNIGAGVAAVSYTHLVGVYDGQRRLQLMTRVSDEAALFLVGLRKRLYDAP